jgi:hypothetical protein
VPNDLEGIMHLRLKRGAPISEQNGFNSCIRPSGVGKSRRRRRFFYKESLVSNKDEELALS